MQCNVKKGDDIVFSKPPPVCVVWLSAAAAGLLLALSTLLTIGGGARERLSAEILAHSRGRNPNQVLSTAASCNSANLNNPCAVNGADCVSCSAPNYTTVVPGTNGGYTIKGNNFACGPNVSGDCTALLVCDTTFGINVGTCAPTPKVIVQP